MCCCESCQSRGTLINRVRKKTFGIINTTTKKKKKLPTLLGSKLVVVNRRLPFNSLTVREGTRRSRTWVLRTRLWTLRTKTLQDKSFFFVFLFSGTDSVVEVWTVVTYDRHTVMSDVTSCVRVLVVYPVPLHPCEVFVKSVLFFYVPTHIYRCWTWCRSGVLSLRGRDGRHRRPRRTNLVHLTRLWSPGA